jgi:hypothetical protein
MNRVDGLCRVLAGALWIAAGCGDASSDLGGAASPTTEAGAGTAETPAARSPADTKPADAPASETAAAPKSHPKRDTKADPKPAMAAADDCSARVVSRSKPCSSDPDPCGLNSGWDGDEYCLLPPLAGEGVQIHFGPKDYSDNSQTDPYVIGPRQVLSESLLARVPLDADRTIGRITVHMRPDVDHWISMGGSNDAEEGVYPDIGCGSGALVAAGGFGGSPNLIYDNPPQGVTAPENEGIVRTFRGNSSACMGMYALNRTDQPQLREAWVNLYYADEPKERLETGGIGLIGGMGLALPPGETTVVMLHGTARADGRIIQLYGQRRQYTPRLAAWLNDQLIYDSRQWEESVTYNYDSITINPPIDPAGLKDGAVSGTLPFKAGDTLKLSCFVDNTSDHTLRFTAELEFSEICGLWGATVGGDISSSSASP